MAVFSLILTNLKGPSKRFSEDAYTRTVQPAWNIRNIIAWSFPFYTVLCVSTGDIFLRASSLAASSNTRSITFALSIWTRTGVIFAGLGSEPNTGSTGRRTSGRKVLVIAKVANCRSSWSFLWRSGYACIPLYANRRGAWYHSTAWMFRVVWLRALFRRMPNASIETFNALTCTTICGLVQHNWVSEGKQVTICAGCLSIFPSLIVSEGKKRRRCVCPRHPCRSLVFLRRHGIHLYTMMEYGLFYFVAKLEPSRNRWNFLTYSAFVFLFCNEHMVWTYRSRLLAFGTSIFNACTDGWPKVS